MKTKDFRGCGGSNTWLVTDNSNCEVHYRMNHYKNSYCLHDFTSWLEDKGNNVFKGTIKLLYDYCDVDKDNGFTCCFVTPEEVKRYLDLLKGYIPFEYTISK